jgi:hypothetical protein
MRNRIAVTVELTEELNGILDDMITETTISDEPRLSKDEIIRALIRLIPELRFKKKETLSLTGVRNEDELFERLVKNLNTLKRGSYWSGQKLG